MDIHFIKVSLTPAEAAQTIKAGINAKIVHEEKHVLEQRTFIVQVFEKYYLRNDSTAGLTVTIHNDSGVTEVTSIASAGGQGLLNISWGANASFAYKIIKILESYRV